MTKALEKKKFSRVNGREIETRLFIYHVLKLFPDIHNTELRRYVASKLGVLVSIAWIVGVRRNIDVNGFYLKTGEAIDERKTEAIKNLVERDVKRLNEIAVRGVSDIASDAALLAKNLKGKMMSELDVRLEGATDSFSNDELIRGSKTMHDIENNTVDGNQFNFNILELAGGLEEFNNKLNELRRKKETDQSGGEATPVNGEVQSG